MSYGVDTPPLRPSHLLERESYVLSDPGDPATPRVSSDFSAILANRTCALNGFFASAAMAARDVWNRLLPEARVASLPRLGVRVPRPGEVVGYLLHHPDMLSPVLLVAMKARQQCGSGGEVSVELYRDPEIRDEYLVVYLRWKTYDKDTLGVVEALGEEAESTLPGASGWILVTTDFRPPQRA